MAGKKLFYVLTDKNNIVRDIIEYEHKDYVPVELDFPLPIGVLGGWFKLENGELVEYPELKPESPLEERIRELEILVMQLSLERGGI